MPARGFLQVLVLQALFFSPILPPLLLAVLGICHESPVVPQVGEDPPSRLQGRPPSRQGLRDLQVQPAFQGPPALSAGFAELHWKRRLMPAFSFSGPGLVIPERI